MRGVVRVGGCGAADTTGLSHIIITWTRSIISGPPQNRLRLGGWG